MKKVFVDTQVFRYASSVRARTHADRKRGIITEAVSNKVTSKTFLMVSNEVVEAEKILVKNESEKLRKEISAILKVAELAKNEKIKLCYSHEVNLELLCQPMVDIAVGRFNGAPCSLVHSPLLKVKKEHFDPEDNTSNPLAIYPFKKYDSQIFKVDESSITKSVENFVRDELLSIPVNSFFHGMNFRTFTAMIREINGYEANTPKLMFPLLEGVPDNRYKEILKMLNADGMTPKKKPNAYMDALHLWTAEESECDIFLSCDNPINNQYQRGCLRVMKPTTLVTEMNKED